MTFGLWTRVFALHENLILYCFELCDFCSRILKKMGVLDEFIGKAFYYTVDGPVTFIRGRAVWSVFYKNVNN